MNEYATEHSVTSPPRPENPMAARLLDLSLSPYPDKVRSNTSFVPSLTSETGRLTQMDDDDSTLETTSDVTVTSNEDLVGITVEVNASQPRSHFLQSPDQRMDYHTIVLTPPVSKSVLATPKTLDNFSPINTCALPVLGGRTTILMVSPKPLRCSPILLARNKVVAFTPNDLPKLPKMATTTTNLSMISPLQDSLPSRQRGFQTPGFYQKTTSMFETPHNTKYDNHYHNDVIVTTPPPSPASWKTSPLRPRQETEGVGGVPQAWLDLYHGRPSLTDDKSLTLAWMRQVLALRQDAEGVEGRGMPPSVASPNGGKAARKRGLDTPALKALLK